MRTLSGMQAADCFNRLARSSCKSCTSRRWPQELCRSRKVRLVHPHLWHQRARQTRRVLVESTEDETPVQPGYACGLAAGPVDPHCSALNIMLLDPRIKLSRSQDEPAPAEGSETSDQLLASSAEDVRARRSTTAQLQPMANVTHMTQQYMGRLAYRYFNWRQDTWNDLQLFATINSVLLFLASVLKAKVIDPLDNEADNSIPSSQHFWQSVYEALVVVFGQDLPDTTASVLQQLWALMVAAVGLAAFALVLALVEQVVLEVLKNNVQRGSQVYEEGHVSRTFTCFCISFTSCCCHLPWVHWHAPRDCGIRFNMAVCRGANIISTDMISHPSCIPHRRPLLSLSPATQVARAGCWVTSCDMLSAVCMHMHQVGSPCFFYRSSVHTHCSMLLACTLAVHACLQVLLMVNMPWSSADTCAGFL